MREQRQKYLQAQLEALQEQLQAQQNALTELDALRGQKAALELALEENEQRALSLRHELENARAALGDLLGKPVSTLAITEKTKSAKTDQSASVPEETHSSGASTRETLQNTLDEVALSFYSRRVALQTEFGALPEMNQPTFSLVQRVLENLAINAFAASPEDGEVVLKVGSAPDENGRSALEILTTHAGEGLTAEEQQRLPETLLNPQSEAPAGIGDITALREAARLLRERGGHWWLKSETGQLTHWRALFPLDAAAQPEAQESH